MDSQVTQGGLFGGGTKKWRTVPEFHGGGYIAGCGDLGPVTTALNLMVKNGSPGEIQGDIVLVWLAGDGVVTHFLTGGSVQIDAPFHADGSGCAIAIGAMAAGADAKRAVEIACDYDTQCGGPVHVLTL